MTTDALVAAAYAAAAAYADALRARAPDGDVPRAIADAYVAACAAAEDAIAAARAAAK